MAVRRADDCQIIWRCRKCNRIEVPDLPKKLPKGPIFNLISPPEQCQNCSHPYFHKGLNFIYTIEGVANA